MTRATIGQLDQLFRIIRGLAAMTFQTPTHIHHLWVLCDLHFRHITVAFFAVQSRGNMRSMHEVDKVRHLCDRHPFNWLVIEDVILQDGQTWTCIRFGDLLVTPPTLCLCWQPWRCTSQRTRMTVQTLDPQIYMNIVPELNWLFRRRLGGIHPKSSKTEQGQCCDQHSNPPHWLAQPFKKIPDHACSCDKVFSITASNKTLQ